MVQVFHFNLNPFTLNAFRYGNVFVPFIRATRLVFQNLLHLAEKALIKLCTSTHKRRIASGFHSEINGNET
jgi:hypothetical protein